MNQSHVLGIDVGSVCIHIAVISTEFKVIQTTSEYHHGEVRQTLKKMLDKIPAQSITLVAATQDTPSFVYRDITTDDQVSIIRTARLLHQEFDAILNIGGEKFSLSLFDEKMQYRGATHNTSCAAGTGSFLDQQARRLNLFDGSRELSENALSNTFKRPDIATRCAVFAKTDLIHAQQEGYNIQQICDGLCYGLAKNIANTLFKHSDLGDRIIFCGGVSSNLSVKNHLEEITGKTLTVDGYSNLYTAIGSALCCIDDMREQLFSSVEGNFTDADSFFVTVPKKADLSYPGLDLKYSTYPDFKNFDSYLFEDVEADIYQDPATIQGTAGFLGMDVGSTSTKSILIDEKGSPVAGFYTKTASRPVQAVQKIFKAYSDFFDRYNVNLEIRGCGTTGSGRRISAKIIGADIEPDEITAHATAAGNLNPDVDTIIEIGGQDAKFTLLKNGVVTSSVMNTVCAAGTGSFIEEQALKLDCPLSEYSQRAEGISSPVASDRCTVFMERDINHYLAKGYSKDEILATVLHSVRDNYLSKVANIAQIGECILFQGATAKNKALVAAFEQKLQKPIHVSKYCHLTGALGVALMTLQDTPEISGFRGFDLWKKQIPVEQEVCQLCTNHCKLTVAQIDGQKLAYGFLCGRDYDDRKFVKPAPNKNSLFEFRKKALPSYEKKPARKDLTIGIPAGLHVYDDIDFWKYFFSYLGIRTITSKSLKQPVKLGKTLAGAEFCAPVVAMHGHIRYLMDKSDFIFLPFYFEEKVTGKDIRRHHCYYTQFTPSVISCLSAVEKERILTPTVQYLYTHFHTKLELYKALKRVSSDKPFSFFDISFAYDGARNFQKKMKQALKTDVTQLCHRDDPMNVVLLGRPYTVLSKAMNNNIPHIFENLDIRLFFQDMIDFGDFDFSEIEPLLTELHWKHAAEIIKTAYFAAKTKNLYPVYITSFKCAPDSFAVDYFKKIMEKFGKPCLVLELDEHDSSVGYETRVEAAIRAFSNHKAAREDNISTAPEITEDLSFLKASYISKPGRKTVIFPNWDSYTAKLIVATLKSEGINALVMEETPETLKKCILTNTGQCIPLNAVAEAYIYTVEKYNLNPADCVLWVNPSEIACNIKMYPYHIQKILERRGNGFEKTQIYRGELTLFDISVKASSNAYFAYMFGGLLRSMGCRVRPYEVNKGQTNQVLEQSLDIFCHTFETGASKEDALKKVVDLFLAIPQKNEKRPKVGIFGDLYVRDNDVMNQDLVKFIEDNGGEVITTPYFIYAKIIANAYFKKWFKEGKYMSLFTSSALLVAMQAMEKRYHKYFAQILNPSDFIVGETQETILSDYSLLPEHTGESMDNILKIHHIIHAHPDLKLLVQTNPAFCCPGMITEAMARKIEAQTKVPVVSITYDVSGGNKNKVIIPFLKDSRIRTPAQDVPAKNVSA